MKKDFVRDYATEAFRLYAKMGKPTYDAARRMISDAALKDSEFKNPETANIKAEGALEKHAPILLDILAVEKTMELLKSGGKGHIARAVEEVYFTDPSRTTRRGDISARVRRHSLDAFVSERNVYSWLKEARLLFASVRGLRLPPSRPLRTKSKSLQ